MVTRMALKADMPDFVNSGSGSTLGIGMLKNDVLPLALGTVAALVAIMLGMGAFQQLRPVLQNVPLVGSLLQSSGGDDRPAAWRGL